MTLTGSTGIHQESRAPRADARLFAGIADPGYAAHLATFGPLNFAVIGSELVAELERSGLTGRGGAGFPAGQKSRAVLLGSARGWTPSSVVIANGAEGEPRSLKDSTLLRVAPHLVIDGLLASARALGASKMYLYASGAGLEFVRHAIAERKDARGIRLVEAPDTFVSGEASAVVNSIENGVALPKDRVVRLTTSGLRRRPTVVHNIETLAHVALIARYGAGWFRAAGTNGDPGTRLVTVSGSIVAERVLEVPGDQSVREILAACGCAENNVGAVLVGGYHGAWLGRAQLGTPLSAAALAPYNAHPGAGVLYVIGAEECGLRISADIVRFLATESARQCGPCMFGLPEMANILNRIAVGQKDRSLRRELESLMGSVIGRGSCHHPDGTARFVASTLRTFSADVEAHFTGHCVRCHGI